jgi:predicted  nucleic acid-binding Zn-ribbon protein
MSDSEKKRMNLELPTEMWERLDQNDETKKGQIVEALEIFFGEEQSGSRSAIERQIQRFQEQRARGQQMIQNGEDMVSEAEEGISRLKARLDELEAASEDYDATIDEQLAFMADEDESVFEGHPTIERIARDHGKTQSEVLNDLRSRSKLNESYFTEGPPEMSDTPSVDDYWGDE